MLGVKRDGGILNGMRADPAFVETLDCGELFLVREGTIAWERTCIRVNWVQCSLACVAKVESKRFRIINRPNLCCGIETGAAKEPKTKRRCCGKRLDRLFIRFNGD